MTRMRWLVADDNDADRSEVTGAIRDADPGASIVEVRDGAHAVRELSKGHTFDAVLTDLRMPYCTGHDVVRVARQAGVQVIAVMTGLTALAPRDVTVLSKGRGMRDRVAALVPRQAAVA